VKQTRKAFEESLDMLHQSRTRLQALLATVGDWTAKTRLLAEYDSLEGEIREFADNEFGIKLRERKS
jgi:hypothetical protein